MNSASKKNSIISALLMLTLSASACGAPLYVLDGEYDEIDLGESLGIVFSDDIPDFAVPLTIFKSEESPVRLSYSMSVIETLKIYNSIGEAIDGISKIKHEPIFELAPGTDIILTYTDVLGWTEVTDSQLNLLGYTDEGFLKSVNTGVEFYAELPIEYGKARNANNKIVDAYSRLVDIGKYLNVYYSTEVSNEGVDLSAYDVKVSMKLSTDDTAINQPFYSRNLCMLQYDTLQKLIKAIEIFRKDGYTLVIYDAYRPTSVQQKWFDKIQIHNWVANPAIGLGGIHDRGVAVDISLIDKNGVEVEMPTKIYSMVKESSRSASMSKTARKNLDYMTKVMTSCGFTYSDNKWWHFHDKNAASYLPTDHPIDEIPLVPSEKLIEKRDVK